VTLYSFFLHVKACVLEKVGDIQMREIDIEEPFTDLDVRIDIKSVGICGSDVHYYQVSKMMAGFSTGIWHLQLILFLPYSSFLLRTVPLNHHLPLVKMGESSAAQHSTAQQSKAQHGTAQHGLLRVERL
jgi:hypothetical protein